MPEFTPCDNGGQCPYGDGYGMYFCRDHCGLGVDESDAPTPEEMGMGEE